MAINLLKSKQGIEYFTYSFPIIFLIFRGDIANI